MHQIALIPSGCHLGSKTILHVTENRLLYVSTLAVYVLNAKTFVVEKILSIHEKSIVSSAISLKDSNFLAVAAQDGHICLWNVTKEEIVSKVAVSSSKIILAWDPNTPSNCAIIINEPNIKIFSWEVFKPQSSLVEIFHVKDTQYVPVCAKWNLHCIGVLGVGCANGVVLIFNTSTKSQKTLSVKDRNMQVVDIQWDRLSPVYMLVAYESFVSLWDAERACEINIFEKQSISITSIAWMDWTAGNFLTTNGKNGIVKVWNASQKQPLESHRISNVGIHTVAFGVGNKRCMCACVDGSVIVYNMLKHQLEFASPAGHIDTIFDCQFNPVNGDCLATASYDGTIKIWDIPSLELSKTLIGANETVYSCDWSPTGNQLVCSTYSGAIILFDVESGNELARYCFYPKPAFCVAWNRFIDGLIVCTSAENAVIAFQVNLEDLYRCLPTNAVMGSRGKAKNPVTKDIDIRLKYVHPSPVYGCAWNKSESRLFATCCNDGSVRIFDYMDQRGPMFVLVGHTARCFSCSWSSINPRLLATSSDDNVVIVWDIDINAQPTGASITVNPYRRLSGHMSHVRAVAWSNEVDGLLLSGAWDATIRLWNVFTGSCLAFCDDHIADVYSIVSHPDNPFTFVSCSRDSTIRVWELGGRIDAVKIVSVWDGSLERLVLGDESASHSNEIMRDESDDGGNNALHSLPTALCGKGSKMLCHGLQLLAHRQHAEENPIKSSIWLAKRYQVLYKYLSGAGGVHEVWNNVVAYLENRYKPRNDAPARLHSITIPENELLNSVRAKARLLESCKLNGKRPEITAKVEEQLREAALLYAQCGDIEKYCSILVDIGDWNGALAVAPSVSMAYWRELANKYGQSLASQASEKCIPYFLGSDNSLGAIEFYLTRQELNSALIVAKTAEEKIDFGRICSPESNGDSKTASSGAEDKGSSKKIDDSSSSSSSSLSESGHGKDVLQLVSLCAANFHILSSRPFTAVAQHLSVGNINAALDILISCEYYDVAYALVKCFNIPYDSIVVQMAHKCAHCGLLGFAVEMLATVNESDVEVGLLLSRFCSDVVVAEQLIMRVSSKPISYWAQRAYEEESVGSDIEASVSFILSRQPVKAASLGLQVLKRYVREPLELPPAVARLLRCMKFIPAAELPEQLRLSFLGHIFWFAAHEALELELWDISCNMLRCVIWLLIFISIMHLSLLSWFLEF